ncbi:hypothetical protein FB451DRAFT_1195870 [Mycena latifolia]|nr:hypothetical protein FB451DRAFT_1195870 [Mycena latifolia]
MWREVMARAWKAMARHTALSARWGALFTASRVKNVHSRGGNRTCYAPHTTIPVEPRMQKKEKEREIERMRDSVMYPADSHIRAYCAGGRVCISHALLLTGMREGPRTCLVLGGKSRAICRIRRPPRAIEGTRPQGTQRPRPQGQTASASIDGSAQIVEADLVHARGSSATEMRRGRGAHRGRTRSHPDFLRAAVRPQRVSGRAVVGGVKRRRTQDTGKAKIMASERSSSRHGSREMKNSQARTGFVSRDVGRWPYKSKVECTGKRDATRSVQGGGFNGTPARPDRAGKEVEGVHLVMGRLPPCCIGPKGDAVHSMEWSRTRREASADGDGDSGGGRDQQASNRHLFGFSARLHRRQSPTTLSSSPPPARMDTLSDSVAVVFFPVVYFTQFPAFPVALPPSAQRCTNSMYRSSLQTPRVGHAARWPRGRALTSHALELYPVADSAHIQTGSRMPVQRHGITSRVADRTLMFSLHILAYLQVAWTFLNFGSQSIVRSSPHGLASGHSPNYATGAVSSSARTRARAPRSYRTSAASAEQERERALAADEQEPSAGVYPSFLSPSPFLHSSS